MYWKRVRIDISVSVADDLFVGDAIEVGVDGGRAKRVYRTAAEKRRIVDATLVRAVLGSLLR